VNEIMAQKKKPAAKPQVPKITAPPKTTKLSKPDKSVQAPKAVAAKPMASKSADAKTAVKASLAARDASVPSSKSSTTAATIKKPLAPAKVASKPVSSPKPSASLTAAAASKPATPKVEMSKVTAKKVEAPKAAASKAAPAKSAVKAAVAPVKASAAPQAKAVAPAAVAKPSTQISAAAKAMVEQRAAAAAQAQANVNVNGNAQRAMPASVLKAPGATISAPATPRDLAQKVAQQAQAAPVATTTVAAAAAAAAAKKPVSSRHGFKTTEWIVYPAHGVGRIIAIEEQEIANMSLELFVIQFEKDKMTLRVPTGKAQTVGMRKLADEGIVKRAMETLKGKARIKRTMWSRRAQEFEAKINSGDLVAIAEVVRDLFRADNQPEQSYSERQLYEAALDRMAREIAAVEKLDERGAVQRITEVLSKSAKGRRAIADEAAANEAVKAA
jgi:CarD family transcriptional regulator